MLFWITSVKCPQTMWTSAEPLSISLSTLSTCTMIILPSSSMPAGSRWVLRTSRWTILNQHSAGIHIPLPSVHLWSYPLHQTINPNPYPIGYGFGFIVCIEKILQIDDNETGGQPCIWLSSFKKHRTECMLPKDCQQWNSKRTIIHSQPISFNQINRDETNHVLRVNLFYWYYQFIKLII